MLYPVCVHQEGDGPLGATIPDFPGCFSAADDWESLPRMIQEAVEVHCDGEEMQAPTPSSLHDLHGRPDCANGAWMLIDVDIGALGLVEPLGRKNCKSLAREALGALDALSEAAGRKQERKDFLEKIKSVGKAGDCWCGCGQPARNYFKPGHDAKAKKYLSRLHYGGCDSNLPKNVQGSESSDIANLLKLHGYGPENRLKQAFLVSLLKQVL